MRGLVCLLLAFGLLVWSSAAAAEVSVRVEKISPEGLKAPVTGLEVALETWRTTPGPGATPSLDGVRHGRTDAEGRARFADAPRAGATQGVVSAVYDGVTYRSEPIGDSSGEVRLQVYDTSASLVGLSGRMTVGLDVRDGFLIVDTTLALTNDSRVTIDTRRISQGLRMPIALPAIGGQPWESGVIPADTGPRHVSLRQTPERGRFQFSKGQIAYEGPLPPGEMTTLQGRYALPIIAERQDLALTVPVPLDQLMVTTTWSDRVSLRVVPDRPFLAIGRQPGEAVQRFMRITSPPKVGEAFVLRIDRLPRPYALRNQLAVGGGVSLVVLFGLSLVALRRRDD